MLTKVKFRAFCALILAVLSLALCACAADEIPAAVSPVPTPESSAPTVLHGSWTGSCDVGAELMPALGIDLSPWLSEPLLATLRFELDEDGACALFLDYGSCEAALRQAIEACVRELQEQEAGEPLGGLALAEALGADPNDLAAALCGELLPPGRARSGRFSADRAEIVWQDGSVSALREEAGALWLTLPPWGEICFAPRGN